ncbi:hypothetical protein BH10BAC3_BH10BAC3_14040 [soil metagenome]
MFSFAKSNKQHLHLAGQWLLVIAGCAQFTGYLFKSPSLRGLGMAYCVAPLPTVFSTVNGVEGFDTKHTLFFINEKGYHDSSEIDQKAFAQFHGHYFLKNAYSIFLAYPHVIKTQALNNGWEFALCNKDLMIECGMYCKMSNAYIQTKRYRFGKKETIQFKPDCSKP